MELEQTYAYSVQLLWGPTSSSYCNGCTEYVLHTEYSVQYVHIYSTSP